MDRLRVKYGLSDAEPSREQARLWVSRTRQFMREGVEAEEAGRRAARGVFHSYGQFEYRAEADTIYDLLQAIERE